MDSASHFLTNAVSLPNTFQNALKPVQSPVRKEIIEDGLVFKDADHVYLFHELL